MFISLSHNRNALSLYLLTPELKVEGWDEWSIGTSASPELEKAQSTLLSTAKVWVPLQAWFGFIVLKTMDMSGSNASTTRLEPRVCVFVSYACVIKPEVRYFRTLNRALTDRWLRGTKTPGTNAVRPVQDTGCSANILRLHHNISYILHACRCKPSQSHPVLNRPSSFSIPSCYFLKCLSTITSI